MPGALACFLTWTTYGTWLPGDARGSIARGSAGRAGIVGASPALERANQASLKHEPTTLDPRQREVVGESIRAVCDHRGWTLHAANVRSNHVHVVVSKTKPPDAGLADLKAWCARALRSHGLVDPDLCIWTKHGSTRHLHTHASLAAAVDYVMRFQDESCE